MYVTRKSPRALLRIHSAIQGAIGYAYNAGEAAGGGGGGGEQDAGKGAEDARKAADKGAADAGKLSITESELQARIDAALSAQERKQLEKAKKDQEAADRKKAEEEGKFKELAQAAEQRAAAAEAKALASERSTLIDREFFAAAKDGVTVEQLDKWVRPGVLASLTPEMTTDEVKTAAKSLAEQYAKDVAAAKPKGSAGAPPSSPRTGNRIPTAPLPQNQERPVRRFSTLMHRG